MGILEDAVQAGWDLKPERTKCGEAHEPGSRLSRFIGDGRCLPPLMTGILNSWGPINPDPELG